MYKLLIPLFALALLIGCSGTPSTNAPNGSSSSASEASTSSEESMQPTQEDHPYGWDGEVLSGKHTVVLQTTMGPVTLELDADAAPKTVTNFVTLAKAGYFDGLTFHRVIPDFMIQGGDPNGNGTGGESIYGDTFEDEPNDLQMVRGAIAMANRGPNTNGSQFFIVTAEATPWLQGRHTVFGRVTDGMRNVDAIVSTPRNARDMPVTPVTFTVTVK